MTPSARTAIARKGPSLPLRWLLKDRLISREDTVLDYGCGKGADVTALRAKRIKAVGWDPYHRPDIHPRLNDVVLCTYVLNVLDGVERHRVLWGICERLQPWGEAFITVRRDLPRVGVLNGVQRWVELPFTSLRKTATYEIYRASRDDLARYLQGEKV